MLSAAALTAALIVIVVATVWLAASRCSAA